MLAPVGGFYVPKSRDHSDHGKLLAGPLWCGLGAGCAPTGDVDAWGRRLPVTLAIALLAAIGAMLVHYNFLQADSFGIGMGVFALVGAFMLYRIFSGTSRPSGERRWMRATG